jgi:cytochrome P450
MKISHESSSNVADARHAGCPVADIAWQGGTRAPLAGFQTMDDLRARGDQHWVSQGAGFHLLTRHNDILAVAQDSDLWSSRYSGDVTVGGEPQFILKPVNLDPPEHQPWRTLLLREFSPGRVQTWETRIREVAVGLIDEIVDRGSCDFVNDFALRFPTSVFLEILGLDPAQLDQFLAWETAILHPTPDTTMSPLEAQDAVTHFFRDLIAQRRATAGEGRSDLMAHAMTWTLDGEPLSDADLESFFLLMFEAGLDTVTAELGYAWLHLATHPQDRQLLLDDPALVSVMVEELLRLYPIVNPGRLATRDTVLGQCPIKKGEYIVMGLSSSGRDERVHSSPMEVDLGHRPSAHLAFGAGRHRCAGSHLARHEMAIAMEEWHQRIPHYEVDEDTPFDESTSTLFGLRALPLTWSTGAVGPH